MTYGEEGGTDLSTLRGRDYPGVRQFSVFLENRVGAMLDLVRRLEASSNRIVAMSVMDSADCAIVRLIMSDPERAVETLQQARLAFLECDVLVVQLPSGNSPIGTICKALLAAEINIHYAYPLLVGGDHRPVLALHVDDHDTGIQTLQRQGFTVLSEQDLETN
ncbi:MAG TPA: acetolactate synthase [Gemmatales bacterium]|nr:acetolactate synthase [Gemmatales bacterium]HMP17109.1 acetolactate synthase [Gemmatales bacterium]